MLADSGMEKPATQHLIETLWRAAALAEVWGQMVADLDDSSTGMRGKVTYTWDAEARALVAHTQDGLLVLDKGGAARIHPFVEQYHAALDRRAKFAKLAIDAGIAQREVELLEAQVLLAHRALESLFEHLRLDDAQRASARQHYARTLRAATE